MKEYTNQTWQSACKSVSKFIDGGMLGGALLLAATIIAFVWANSPFHESYDTLIHVPISLSVGAFELNNSVGHWINDGLMAVFFFSIGLEIKRELLVGELSDVKSALLPAVAALGGMIVPATLYVIINMGGQYTSGWGIPIATDIAFALGVVVILGNRVPLSLKVFLLALAIFDDMGAILIIALFYTDEINILNIGIGIVILMISSFMNYKGVRKISPYALLGIVLWLAFLGSGIHATVAGVLLAFTIPARSKHDNVSFKKEAHDLIHKFPESYFDRMVIDEGQRDSMKRIQCSVEDLDTPLQKLEDKLHGFANYFIIPLFALANAGVSVIHGKVEISLIHPISLGIIIGLIIGKPLGICLFVLASDKLGFTRLPEGITKLQFLGVSCLGGIGFTMSLFITNLAFMDLDAINQAKVAILIASLVAAILGVFLLTRGKKENGEGI